MEPKIGVIQQLLPYGSIKTIAKKLGVSSQAVGLALKAGRPSSRAVQEALRMIKESGAIEAAQTLATLPQNS